MAWTTPGTATAGEVLTAAFWNTQVRDNMVELAPFSAAWVSYTPALTNCTAPITHARYLKVGRMVCLSVQLTLTGAQVSGLVGIALPFAARTQQTGTWSVNFEDTGSALVQGAGYLPGTDKLDIYAINASTTYAQWTATTSLIPFTWANTDKIFVNGVYEAAS